MVIYGYLKVSVCSVFYTSNVHMVCVGCMQRNSDVERFLNPFIPSQLTEKFGAPSMITVTNLEVTMKLCKL